MPREQHSGLEARHETVYDLWADPIGRGGEFDPSASPLYRQLLFVVGAPRSGTTWLQQLLVVHPHLATGGESHVFCEGLPAIFDNFSDPQGTSHLKTWVSEAELLRAARGFCDAVFDAQRVATRPDARFILEKTPNHRLQAALQARLYPDAHYVHIVRDGRDSAASQNRLWGRHAGEYANLNRVATGWADSVRDVRTHFGELHYLELRYEDVVRDTAGSVATIFDFVGLTYDDALCADAAAFGAAPVNTAPDSVTVGVREHKGNVAAERAVARAAPDLLVEFGYADQAELTRMANQRNRDTILLDARDLASSSVTRAKAEMAELRTRWRKRQARKLNRPAQLFGKRLADALEAGTDITALFAPDVKLDDSASSATKTAAAVKDRLASSRLATRRASDGYAQLVFVSDDGTRTVVRAKVKGDLAVAVDLR